MVKNPFNPSQIKTVSLLPDDVDAIVFWTRNADPIFPGLKELDQQGFPYIFLYTITGYGPPLEKNVPSLEKSLKTFKMLSQRIGPKRVIWRFDPIIYVSGKAEKWILSLFEKIARSLKNDTQRVIISFLDLYKKVLKKLSELEKTNDFRVIDIINKKNIVKKIACGLSEMADNNGMEIYSCAEKINLEGFGIKPGSCIDGNYLNKIFGLHLKPIKDKSQRPECRCTASQDIGKYNTCKHECIYCYAVK